MFVDQYDLTIEGEQLETFYINATNHKDETGRFSFNEEGEKQEFVYVGRGRKEDFEGLDLQGKIAVCSVVLPESDSIMAMADWFDNAEIYDPEGKMQKTLPRIDIYSPGEWPNNYFYAVKAGAAGFVGILENYGAGRDGFRGDRYEGKSGDEVDPAPLEGTNKNRKNRWDSSGSFCLRKTNCQITSTYAIILMEQIERGTKI